MKIAVIGAGKVGGTLGGGLERAGHDIVYGVRDPEDPKHAALLAAGARADTVRGAVEASELVLLTTPWAAVRSALEAAGDLGGRPLLDATNPIGPGLTLTHGHTDSGAEQVARWAVGARVVKIFNTTGVENMAAPVVDGRPSVMLACADDADARALALGLARDLGFEPVDAGPLAQARLLEPLALLWIKLALQLGQGRGFAFGVLRRETGD